MKSIGLHIVTVSNIIANEISSTDYQGPGWPRKKSNGFEKLGKNSKELRYKFDEFIKSIVDLVRDTSSTRTQPNESINASIRIDAPKSKIFASSNESRV